MHKWSNPAYQHPPYVPYQAQFPPNQPKPYVPRPMRQVPTPTLVLPLQQPTHVKKYHVPNQGRYPNQICNHVMLVTQVEYDPKPLKEGEITYDYVKGVNKELVPMYRIAM